jgi:hypothetical protein
MFFTCIDHMRLISTRISVSLTIFAALMTVLYTNARAQSANREIEPVNMYVHPRIGEVILETPPTEAITKRPVTASLWPWLPEKQSVDTFFRPGKTNSEAIEILNLNRGSTTSTEALAAPKTGSFSYEPSLRGERGGSANIGGMGGGSSVLNPPVHDLGFSSPGQARQDNAKIPLSKDPLGPITPHLEMYGLRSNLERNRLEFGSIASSMGSLSAGPNQPASKPANPLPKKSLSRAESKTLRGLPPSTKRPNH